MRAATLFTPSLDHGAVAQRSSRRGRPNTASSPGSSELGGKGRRRGPAPEPAAECSAPLRDTPTWPLTAVQSNALIRSRSSGPGERPENLRYRDDLTNSRV